jgi:hypothetical protein
MTQFFKAQNLFIVLYSCLILTLLNPTTAEIMVDEDENSIVLNNKSPHLDKEESIPESVLNSKLTQTQHKLDDIEMEQDRKIWSDPVGDEINADFQHENDNDDEEISHETVNISSPDAEAVESLEFIMGYVKKMEKREIMVRLRLLKFLFFFIVFMKMRKMHLDLCEKLKS